MARTPSKKERLRRLLAAGYFPKELPPVFVSTSFADVIAELVVSWPEKMVAEWVSVPERFTIPKDGHVRRTISIVNPINQYKLSEVLSGGWIEIRNFIRSSGLTEFTPIIDMSGSRAILPSNFTEINKRRGRLRARFNRVLRSDINRFYPSIYTHSIPWALHGKAWVKANLFAPALKAKLGDKIDRAVRDGQGKQTIGIPVGPETSRVIAEIVAVGIDKEIYPTKKIAKNSGLRYVDDYSIGIPIGLSEDEVVSNLVIAFRVYDLDINGKKTKVDITGVEERPAWVRAIKNFPFRRGAAEQSLRDYFDEAIYHYNQTQDDSLVTYAIKRSRSFRLDTAAANYYLDRCLHLARICPDAMPAIVQAILDRNVQNPGLDLSNAKSFVLDVVREKAPLSQFYEIVWALFLARGLKMEFKRKDLSLIYGLDSSICALVTMDIDNRGRLAGGADQRHWQSFASAEALKGDMWLLAYEAVRKGWWRGVSDAYVKDHPLFGEMYDRGVFFYDETKNVPTTAADLKQLLRDRVRWALMFKNIDSYG